MKPSGEFKNRLYINSGAPLERIVEFSCDHIIPPENILPIIITEGPNKEKLIFNYEQRMTMVWRVLYFIIPAIYCEVVGRQHKGDNTRNL